MVLAMHCQDKAADNPAPAEFPFLASISSQSRQLLVAEVRSSEFRQGEGILKKGDEAGGVFLVQQGALRVYYITPQGREGTLFWVEPGQSCILSLNCTFTRIPYPAWVEADRDCTKVAVVPGGLYRDLFAREPAIQTFTFEALSSRLFDLMTRLEAQCSLGVEQRLARLLVQHADAAGKVHMSQERLAHHLGTAREVVSRTLRGLAQRGLVALRPGAIGLLSEGALRDLASALDENG